MQNLSKKTFIAIEAVLYIACAGDQPVRSKDICAYQGVTLRYLEHIMQQLVRDSILRGIRGPRGGYLLARDRRKILLSDIYQSMDELAKAEENASESELSTVVILPIREHLKDAIIDQLGEKSIQDLYEQARESQVDVAMKQKSDFVI